MTTLIARIPPEMFAKLEAAEIYHQLLEHRWFLSEDATVDVTLMDALDSYLTNVLAAAPDEVTISRQSSGSSADESDTFQGYE